VHPTSESQATAYATKAIPPTEVVRDGMFAVPIPLGNRYVPYAFSYAIEDAAGSLHLIDAGGLATEHVDALGDGLRSVGHTLDDIATVTVTHLHPDHLGLAERIRATTGASIALHRVEQASLLSAPGDLGELLVTWGVPAPRHLELLDRPSPVDPVTADLLLDDGDRLPVSGRELVVVHTPGHTAGSICLEDATERLLFTGDHLLPDQFPGIGVDSTPTGNPVRDYLHSLERIAAFADHEALPGHGWRFTGIPARVHATRAHHGRRTSEVAAALAEDPTLTLWDLASRLTWSAGWGNLGSFYLRSALLQTSWHREIVLEGQSTALR
jgi:glyoxylase-like metal-dependent hydrolase (beta-lactamase superfamily II)